MPDKLARMQVEVNAETEGLSQGLDQATADINAFEQSLNGLSTQALDQMLASLESQFNVMAADLAKIDATIEMTQNKMAMSGMKGPSIDANPKIIKMQQSAMNLENSLALVKQQIDMVKAAINKVDSKPINRVKDAFKAAGQNAADAGEKTDLSMKKSLKGVGKLGAMLLGLRTIYSVITKAVQAYLGQNQELQNRIDSMYVALGTLMAPAIELVVKWMTELVRWVIVAAAYTTKFLNVMFGLNLQINTSVNSTNQLTKSLKGTSKALSNLAGFDDLTILQDTEASSTTPQIPQIDLTPFDMSAQLAGLDAFGEKLKSLQPILAPLLIALASLVAIQIALNVAMTANPIGLIIVGIGLLIAAIIAMVVYWDQVKQAVINFAVSVIAKIAETWNTVSTFAKNLANIFVGVWEGLKKGFQTAFQVVQKVFTDVWNGILKLLGAGGKIFSGIVDGISNVFKSVVNAIISGINKIIATPFNVINGLLNTIRSTSILGFKPFTGLWGVNPLPVPQIPKLATGAVVTNATIAQIGEGRYDEAVIPLGQSPQFSSMKEDIANAVLQGMSGLGSSGPIEITMIVEGDTFGRVAIKNINNVQRQAGRTLLKV